MNTTAWKQLAVALLLAGFAACASGPSQDAPAAPTATVNPEYAAKTDSGQASIWDDRSGPTVEAGGQPAPTVVGYEPGNDPLMGMNRAIFAFNDVTYRFALIPAAQAWDWAVPKPVRTSIGNAFHNIRMPIRAVNHGLQGRFSNAGRNLLRFTINSTLGLGGLFDPAAGWFDIERADTGFDETLARWGAGHGAYLVLPLLGPSSLREGGASIVDYGLNPIPYLSDQPEQTALMLGDGFQGIAPTLISYKTLREQSDDPYVFFRELHLQGLKRDAQHRHTGKDREQAPPDADNGDTAP